MNTNHLEQYIREHKSQFDEEPAEGHFDRMQHKIKREPRRTIALRWSIPIAACIALLLSAGIIWQYARTQTSMMICENTDDMKVCYLDKMNAVADQIEIISSDFDQWDQQQVMIDVQNIIDAASSGFENEIPPELPDDKTKEILSDYYKQNLESLERIEQRIKEE